MGGLGVSVATRGAAPAWIDPAPAAAARARIERGVDRRRRPSAISRFSLFGGRRRRARRREEVWGYIPDQHGLLLFAAVVAVAALNILDALYTVLFLSYGGTELNPVVDWVLSLGVWPFIALKSLGIGVCVGFLTITKNFLASRIGLVIVLLGYSALLGWHLSLLDHIPG